MYEVGDITLIICQIAVQIAVVCVLIKHGRSFADQVKEARRDAVVRMRIQLGDTYLRCIAQDDGPARERLRDQLIFLLQGWDELCRQVGHRRDDELIKKIRDECKPSGQQDML